MSGHSKWATIKHKKGAADKARGKLFAKLARQIEVAAKAGGDVDSNPTLRTAVQKAKAGRMTNDAIDRAIKRGSGEGGDAVNYETIMYEGYAPGGVALLIDVLTDNRNRISADVRQVFSKLGGSMAEPGAVGWQFARRGVIITADGMNEDDVMLAALDAGADDIIADGSSWRIMTDPSDVYDVQARLGEAGIETISADSPMVAENLVEVTELKDAKAILRILEALEDNDDVQDVFSNFDISDDLMEAAVAE
jgi:YebC/PmpR family DNA-binding regulatory protein